jgi:VanZ family protein
MFTALVSTPKWVRALPALLCMAAIFWLSVIKAPSLRLSEHWFWDNIDKVAHAIAYSTLCVICCWSFRQVFEKKLQPVQIWSIAGFSFMYGLSIEIVQHFLPHRSFDPFDMLANAVGVLIGAVIFAKLSTSN